jgi:hypothetical protein
MNIINRLGAIIIALAIGAGAVVFILLSYTSVIHSNDLRLNVHLREFLDQLIAQAQYNRLEGIGIPALVLLGVLLILYIELAVGRPQHAILLNAGATGSTELELSAVRDLARWFAEEVDGVEQMPRVRVSGSRKKLRVTGMVLLNPFSNARYVTPVLETDLKTKLAHATGFPVDVKLRSRFQDIRARRKVR